VNGPFLFLSVEGLVYLLINEDFKNSREVTQTCKIKGEKNLGKRETAQLGLPH